MAFDEKEYAKGMVYVHLLSKGEHALANLWRDTIMQHPKVDRNKQRDENFLAIAKVISEMATCTRAKHGAVIVNDLHRIVCTGYNGSLPGQPHCTDIGCDIRYTDGTPHCHRTIHAERNALMQAARFGVPVDNCRIYITGKPCEECEKHLAAAGITRIHYPGKH